MAKTNHTGDVVVKIFPTLYTKNKTIAIYFLNVKERMKERQL